MTNKWVAVDAVVLIGWVFGLLTVEWVALVLGVIGCVTGCVALYQATRAMKRLAEISGEQESEVTEFLSRTERPTSDD